MIASVPRVTVPRVILAPPLFATTTLSTHDGGRKTGGGAAARWCGAAPVSAGLSGVFPILATDFYEPRVQV